MDTWYILAKLGHATSNFNGTTTTLCWRISVFDLTVVHSVDKTIISM
jgi:hypothetical protein